MSAIPETMRALVLSGTGFDHLALKVVPVPRPGPNQLLARVDAEGKPRRQVNGKFPPIVNALEIEATE